MAFELVRRIKQRAWLEWVLVSVAILVLAALGVSGVSWYWLLLAGVVLLIVIQLARMRWVRCRYCGSSLRRRTKDVSFQHLTAAAETSSLSPRINKQVCTSTRTFGWKIRVVECPACQRMQATALQNHTTTSGPGAYV